MADDKCPVCEAVPSERNARAETYYRCQARELRRCLKRIRIRIIETNEVTMSQLFPEECAMIDKLLATYSESDIV